jgi:hypothetical protein
MPRIFDDATIDQLLAEGLSINQAADRLNIPRTSLKRHLQKRESQEESSKVDQSTPESTATKALMVYPSQPLSTPALNPQQVGELSQLLPVLRQMAQEWIEHRQLMQVNQSQPKSTVRWTYHVEERWVQAVKDHAKRHRLSESAVVNLIFQSFFQPNHAEISVTLVDR